jgi:hypothetical protein
VNFLQIDNTLYKDGKTKLPFGDNLCDLSGDKEQVTMTFDDEEDGDFK